MERGAADRRFVESMRLGYQYLMDGEALAAREQFLDAIRLKPERSAPHLYMAHTMKALENERLAEHAFLLALRRADDDPVLRNDYGNFLQRTGRLADAVGQYEAALRHDPQNADVWSNLGSANYKLKRHDEAVKALKQAVEVEPQHTRAHTTLGLALEALGRWTDAEVAFRKAIEVAPDLAYTDIARQRLEEGERAVGERLTLEVTMVR
jgi:Tfp pilus assembly protein PilF